MVEPSPRIKGVAQIKAEYVLPYAVSSKERNNHDDDLAERETNPATTSKNGDEDDNDEPDQKKLKLSGAARKRAKKELEYDKRKASRGQNKGRKFAGIKDQIQLCNNVARGRKCGRDG
jgi:tRNA-dihydrouridine synthase 3